MSRSARTPLDRVKSLFESERGHSVERYLSPHTHPGGNIGRTTLQKLRVLLNFVIRRLSLGTGRHQALQALRLHRGAGREQEILVIGSGPSANSLQAREVKKRQKAGELLVVATNYFLNSPLARIITPDYLVWADDVFDPGTPSSSSHEWARAQAADDVTLVVPWTWKDSIDTSLWANRILFFDNDSLEGWSKNISPIRPRGYQGSTGVKALAFALHLMPRIVLLIGLDLSYYKSFVVDHENRVLRQPAHIAGADSGVQDISHHSVHGLADALYSTSSQFLALQTHFAGHPIINLDPNSLVDAFPKVTGHPLTKK